MKGMPFLSNPGSRKAQAVIEIATFGAVIIFLIGAILSQGTNSAYQQNSMIQSMRLAMLRSYQTSQAGMSAYNTASFVVLEDRLSTGNDKYGASERQPFMASGNGTLTKNLFLPADWTDLTNPATKASYLPAMDVRVNGQTFKLRLADKATYRVRYTYNGGDEQANEDSSRLTLSLDLSPDGACVSAGTEESITCDDPAAAPCEMLLGDTSRPVQSVFDEQARRLRHEWFWYAVPAYTVDMITGGTLTAGEVGGWKTSDGFVPFYRSAAKRNDDFPESDFIFSSSQCMQQLRMRKYDLNRDGIYPDICCPNPLAYTMWRWAWKSLSEVQTEIKPDDQTYPNWDIDGDLNEENLYAIKTNTAVCATGGSAWRYDVSVLDWDIGDYNSSEDADSFANPDDAPGWKRDMKIMSKQEDGTYLDVTEGSRLCTGKAGAPKSCSRSTLKRNQFDFVERKFVLNRRMIGCGTLCNSDCTLPAVSGVEFCCSGDNGTNCCEEGDRQYRTCVQSTPAKKVLYIRSRIRDQRGRGWLTDTKKK